MDNRNQSGSTTSGGGGSGGSRRSRTRIPRPLKFHPTPVPLEGEKFIHLRPVEIGQSLPSLPPQAMGIRTVTLMTVRLLEMFAQCNPAFHYDRSLNPRRVLTKPHRPTYNNGWDNERHDYILYVNDILGSEEEGRRYVILDLLGQGTFGQVVKCQNMKTRELVAIKVIKNQTAFFNQSMMEVTVLELLNQRYDRDDRRHIVRLRDTFVFRQHLCIVVELLSLNLYDLIKQNQYRGFSLTLCRLFLSQILDALKVLKEARIIHCDLKPENILLRNLESPAIKVIDFGSACHEHQTLYTYIQSRFYRSPEVLLGLPYSTAIDMWSLGCIAAELFLGLPIFPGASNYDQVSRIVATLGLPPSHMLEVGKETSTYFERIRATVTTANTTGTGSSSWQLKSRERYSLDTGRVEPPPKQYFSSSRLEEIIMNYPIRPRDLGSREREAEIVQRRCFLDFVRGLLTINPLERWSPWQAAQHPFITGKTWTGLPFVPPTATATGTTMAISSTRILPTSVASNSTTNTNNPNASTAAAPTGVVTSTATSIARIKVGQRPRANTLSSLSLQDVPPQLQKITAARREKGGPGIAPTERTDTIPEAILEASETNGGEEIDAASSSLPPIESYLGAGATSGGGASGMTSLSSSYTAPMAELANNGGGSGSIGMGGNNGGGNRKSAAGPSTTERMSAYMSNRRVSQPVTAALTRIRIPIGPNGGGTGGEAGSNGQGGLSTDAFAVPNSVPTTVWYGPTTELTTTTTTAMEGKRRPSLRHDETGRNNNANTTGGTSGAAPNVGKGIRRGSLDLTMSTATSPPHGISSSTGRRKSMVSSANVESPRRSNLSTSFVSGEMFPLTLDSPIEGGIDGNNNGDGRHSSGGKRGSSSSMEPVDECDEDGDYKPRTPSQSDSSSSQMHLDP